ncbi:MAG: Hsp20/alpha crystallin family protein [Alkalispirochaeta sp.]
MNYMTVRRPANGTVRSGALSDFDRLFDSVFNTMPGWSDRKPTVDIRATDEEYILDADLPGFAEDQIDVRVENDLLVISAKDEAKKVDGDTSETTDETPYLVRERHMRSFHRSFALPKDADTSAIDGSYKNGVLTLRIHKKAEAKPRQIEIKRG